MRNVGSFAPDQGLKPVSPLLEGNLNLTGLSVNSLGQGRAPYQKKLGKQAAKLFCSFSFFFFNTGMGK